jgi:hypothetical protein
MKHKMWAVCYEDASSGMGWVPYGENIHHFRGEALKANRNCLNARVLPVMVEVILPKRRKSAKR